MVVMNRNYSRYLVIIALLSGLIVGMLQYQLVVPAAGNQLLPYYYGTRGKNQVALTFNVDWGQEFIPSLLQIMKGENVKATFFVTGDWSSKFPDLLKIMADDGHEIGNHGYSHRHPVHLNNQQLAELINKNEDLIFNITGKRTALFAPPYGEVDDRIARVADNLGYKTIMWSADTIDWQRPSPQIIVQRAVNKVDDGGIILMHPTRPTVQALPEIINKLQNRGFEIVTVSRLIGDENR